MSVFLESVSEFEKNYLIIPIGLGRMYGYDALKTPKEKPL